MNDLRCPQCGLPHTKKNGHTYYGKQNYQCLSCGRQFALDSQWIDQPTSTTVVVVRNTASLSARQRCVVVTGSWLNVKEQMAIIHARATVTAVVDYVNARK